MQKYFILLTFFICLRSEAAPFRVVIDPGHGGTDSGAIAGDIRESELTLQISKKVAELLKQNDNFDAILTRNQDDPVSLNDRCKMASEFKANLFISIHMNSSPDTHAHGTEIYFQSQMPPDEETLFLANRENSELASLEDDPNVPEKKGDLAVIIDDIKKTQNIFASEVFAQTLAEVWKKHLPLRDQPIRQGPFRVLTTVSMPSVLIEVGFITHPEERIKLKSTQYQNEVAQAIVKSINKFKEKMDKTAVSSHIMSSL